MQSDKALKSRLQIGNISTVLTGLSTFSVESAYPPVVAISAGFELVIKTNIIRWIIDLIDLEEVFRIQQSLSLLYT